ncbi:PAS domain-containing protein [Streptomyces cadmiisoli]|uniref:PAS domain-containing protein n=1 Tax=Streptomyces cadmiisoli TaxID=2184053 RepID=UPI001FEBFAE8|nr:PAS domain-containing protein [Streptomyces cadmiisoli]
MPDQPLRTVGASGALHDLLPSALWREDEERRVLEWSPAAEDLLGHRPEAVLGRPARDVLVPDGDRALAEAPARRVQAGETVVGTFCARHRDGHRVTPETCIVPVTDRAPSAGRRRARCGDHLSRRSAGHPLGTGLGDFRTEHVPLPPGGLLVL